jgi:hypothetical protein
VDKNLVSEAASVKPSIGTSTVVAGSLAAELSLDEDFVRRDKSNSMPNSFTASMG